MEINTTKQPVTQKPRRKFSDSPGAAYLLAFMLMLTGEIISMGFRFFPQLSAGPVLKTGMFYLKFIGIWIATMLYLGITKKNRPILKVLWTKPSGNTLPMFLLGLIAGFAMNGVCVLAAWLHGDIKLVFDSLPILSVLWVFVCIFVQSSAEELICRGFLYQRLMRRYRNPIAAIVGNSLFFGILHVLNPGVTVLSIANVVFAGILFSLLVYCLDSIWCAMALHAAWNFTQNILFGLPNSGNVVPFSVFRLDAASAVNSFAYDRGFGIEGTAFSTAVIAIACIALFVYGKNHPKKQLDIWQETEAEYV